tara:strand:+ start:469 stop:666 length:198 start_codon:yes stop_codon:yes gene_type:complete
MVKPIIRSKTRRESNRPGGIVEIWDKKGLVGIEAYSSGTLKRVLRRKKKRLTRKQYESFIKKRKK